MINQVQCRGARLERLEGETDCASRADQVGAAALELGLAHQLEQAGIQVLSLPVVTGGGIALKPDDDQRAGLDIDRRTIVRSSQLDIRGFFAARRKGKGEQDEYNEG